ncbi:MAG: hypothetical protein FJX74_24045, partial [Armatimonadetes bacterium]|nr:hypothetical protein [Armatimonadota bacterium]
MANLTRAPSTFQTPDGTLTAWDWVTCVANAVSAPVYVLREGFVVLGEPVWIGGEGDYGTGWGTTWVSEHPQFYQVRREPAVLEAFAAALRDSPPGAVAALLDGAEVPLVQLGGADPGGLASVVEGLCAGSPKHSCGIDARSATAVLRRIPWTLASRYIRQLGRSPVPSVGAANAEQDAPAVSLSTPTPQPLGEILADLGTDDAKLTCDPRVA